MQQKQRAQTRCSMHQRWLYPFGGLGGGCITNCPTGSDLARCMRYLARIYVSLSYVRRRLRVVVEGAAMGALDKVWMRFKVRSPKKVRMRATS